MLRFLNLLNVEMDVNQLFSEICDWNEVLPFIKGELAPSVSGPSHSQRKESDQRYKGKAIPVTGHEGP
jgi:hypothetical protein